MAMVVKEDFNGGGIRAFPGGLSTKINEETVRLCRFLRRVVEPTRGRFIIIFFSFYFSPRVSRNFLLMIFFMS